MVLKYHFHGNKSIFFMNFENFEWNLKCPAIEIMMVNRLLLILNILLIFRKILLFCWLIAHLSESRGRDLWLSSQRMSAGDPLTAQENLAIEPSVTSTGTGWDTNNKTSVKEREKESITNGLYVLSQQQTASTSNFTPITWHISERKKI